MMARAPRPHSRACIQAPVARSMIRPPRGTGQ